MKKKRKKLLLLSSIVFSLGYLTTLVSNNFLAHEVAADSFNVEETTAFVHFTGREDSTDAHIVIHLTDNDFGETQNIVGSSFRNKIDAINLANQIKINGEPVNFDSYNSLGYKLGEEMHINLFEPKNGSLSIRLNFNGVTSKDVTSITITDECELPSQGYLNDSSNQIYKLKSELNAHPANCNYDWVSFMDTDVYSVTPANGNTYLGISLSVNDYPTPNGSIIDGTIGSNNFSNYHTKVSVDNTSVIDGYGLFGYLNVYNSIWIRTTDNANLIREITIEEGTIFSSYQFVKNSPKIPLFFRCIEERTFVKNSNNSFAPIFDEVETEIEEVNFSINRGWLGFKLKNSDYLTFLQKTFNKSAEYNFWNKIEAVDTDGVSHLLSEICVQNAHIFNFNNELANQFAVNLISPYSNVGYIKKIIIPSGTEFPNFAYLNGTSNGDIPKAYVIHEDVNYYYGTNATLFAKAIETEVTDMNFNSNGYLGFALSNNDYPEPGNVTGGMETIYTNCREKIDISGVGLSFISSPYSLWSYDKFANSISPVVDGTLKEGRIYIPKGTLFPSYIYSLVNQNAYPTVYETTSDSYFMYKNNDFIDINHPWTISNSITKLETHGDINTNEFAIDIILEEFDWPNSITDLDLINNANHGDKSYKNIYNTFNKIFAFDENDNLISFTSELFVNVWHKTGCLSFRLDSPTTNIQKLSYIRIDSGLEFPTYGGNYVDENNGKYSDNSRYLISDNYIFMYDNSNHTFVKSSAINKKAAIAGVNELEGNKQNSLISITLNNSDYSSVNNSFNVNGEYLNILNKLNLKDYITINGKKLSEYSISDIFISNNNTFSFRILGNNTGYYYVNQENRVYTSDLTRYEVRIAKGAQFPSYAYLTNANQNCYLIDKDYSFIWFNDQYVLDNNDLNVDDLMLNKISYVNKNNSGYIYLSVNNTDWSIT